jgi:nicotinate-nucleotide adenylyltransferase
MKVGLFGGTFNPIHVGHLRVAFEILHKFLLDRMIFIPSAKPPHKSGRDIVAPKYRFEMVNLAIEKVNKFFVSDVEIKRGGFSYTIDTILYFKEIFPIDTELYLVVGLDAFLEIDTWMSYMEIFDHITFIIMTRPKTETENKNCQKLLEQYLKKKISKKYKYFKNKFYFLHMKKPPLYLIDVTHIDISSTKIRKILQIGESVKFLIPEKVEEYIKFKGLYK